MTDTAHSDHGLHRLRKIEIVLLAEFSGLIIGYLADLLRYFG